MWEAGRSEREGLGGGSASQEGGNRDSRGQGTKATRGDVSRREGDERNEGGF